MNTSLLSAGFVWVSKPADESQRDLQLVLLHLRVLPEQSSQLEERSPTQPVPAQHVQESGEQFRGSLVSAPPVRTTGAAINQYLQLNLFFSFTESTQCPSRTLLGWQGRLVVVKPITSHHTTLLLCSIGNQKKNKWSDYFYLLFLAWQFVKVDIIKISNISLFSCT